MKQGTPNQVCLTQISLCFCLYHARAARPRAGERESASAGHDATGGCPPTRSRAARAGYLRRGTPPCSSMPPRRCSAPRVEPSVGSGPSLPPVRRVSRPPVIASPLLLFVGCCRPVARDPRPARPAPCASLASFHDGSDQVPFPHPAARDQPGAQSLLEPYSVWGDCNVQDSSPDGPK